MCGLEIPIEDKGKYPLCYGLSNEHGTPDMCDACKFQHDCAKITMKLGDYFTFSYTTYGSCLECRPNKPGFCLVLQYGTKIFRLCLPCLMKIEHQVFQWKIEEDDKKIWKPHKEWLDTA